MKGVDASVELTAMIHAARTAGEGLLGHFMHLNDLGIRTKTGPADMVSIADEESEVTVRELLARCQPDYEFIGEEGGECAGAGSDRQWIVDPLDGTTNFLFGTPLWGVNIALAEQGEVIAGVIYLPVLQEMYIAERGKGAWLNDRPIRVSTRTRLVDSLLGCGIPFAGKPDHPVFAREMRLLSDKVAGIRRTGACSVDMAFVAAGRWDAYWERSLNSWDMAPGVILVREAGGRVSAVDGSPINVNDGNICLTNGYLHEDLIEILNTALAQGE